MSIEALSCCPLHVEDPFHAASRTIFPEAQEGLYELLPRRCWYSVRPLVLTRLLARRNATYSTTHAITGCSRGMLLLMWRPNAPLCVRRRPWTCFAAFSAAPLPLESSRGAPHGLIDGGYFEGLQHFFQQLDDGRLVVALEDDLAVAEPRDIVGQLVR